MLEHGCMEPMIDLLSRDDTRLVAVALEFAQNVLRLDDRPADGGKDSVLVRAFDDAYGLDELEQLFTHPDEDISSKARRLFAKFSDDWGGSQDAGGTKARDV